MVWIAAEPSRCFVRPKSKLGEGPLNVGLPSEAQWEYACRAGTDTEYATGDGEAALHDAGWYTGNSNDETHDVGLTLANRFGLYDMHGNVWEWCADAFDEHAYKKRVNDVCDPFIDGDNDANRVIRGGSWDDSPRLLPLGVSQQEGAGPPCQEPGLSCLSVPRSVPRPGRASGAGERRHGNEGRGSGAEARSRSERNFGRF